MPKKTNSGKAGRKAPQSRPRRQAQSQRHTDARPRVRSPRTERRGFLSRIPAGWLAGFVFAAAFVVRLVYVSQLGDAPFFYNPVGDSKIYHERALEIAAGDLVGRDAYFHSSPFYPYFLALVYRVFGVNLWLVRLIQIIIGSLNCVLVYWLARRLAGELRGPPLLAGLFAAFYGTLVFFDGDLLMITLVLFFVLLSVLLLVTGDDLWRASRETGKHRSRDGSGAETARPHGEENITASRFPVWALFLIAGVSLGVAGLGKPNVLVFAPFALWWILTGFQRGIIPQRWPFAVVFTVGVLVAVLPITARNYAVSGDFVLVSSNAGVNLFIGNNDQATGIFLLPPGSGLENTHLYLSSRDTAGQALGEKNLRPSAVSRYWAGRALDYIREEPADAVRLLAKKFVLFWNQYEIPNHHNRYFIGIYYAPLLKHLFIGFWLITPLSMIGLFFLTGNGENRRVFRLYFGFILVYMISLIPFFVTARYRLPVVPFLIVFASLGVFELARWAARRPFRRIAAGLITAAVAAARSSVWSSSSAAPTSAPAVSADRQLVR